MPPAATTTDNHDLLLLVSGKVDDLGKVLEKSNAHTAAEITKLWEHVEARDERLTRAITAISEKVAGFGKPNAQAIVAVCMLVGGIAVAFIAPIKADISREETIRRELAQAVIVRQESLDQLARKQIELETDLKWIRGEKRITANNN